MLLWLTREWGNLNSSEGPHLHPHQLRLILWPGCLPTLSLWCPEVDPMHAEVFGFDERCALLVAG